MLSAEEPAAIALLPPRQHCVSGHPSVSCCGCPGPLLDLLNTVFASVPLRQALDWLTPLLLQLTNLPSGNTCRMSWRCLSNCAHLILLSCSCNQQFKQSPGSTLQNLMEVT